MMQHETPLDTIEAIRARYHDVLINHAVHHSTHPMNNALLYPLHARMDSDHSIAANHDLFVADYLGKDPKTALYKLYKDLVEQLDQVRKTNFTDDHETYAASGYPERSALNPKNGLTLPELIGKARELALVLDPDQEAPTTYLDKQKVRSAQRDVARTISSLHRRYETALTPPPGARPLLESRRELLEYSCDLVETMHRTVFAALGAQRGGAEL